MRRVVSPNPSVDSDGGSEESMDLDSDEDDAPVVKKPMSNPYPLEGKYTGEDDRD